MEVTNFLDLVLPLKDRIMHFYSIGSLIVFIIAILWIFNLVATFIHRTFILGKTVGSLYRKFIHKFIKVTISQIFQIFYAKDKINVDIKTVR